MKVHLDYKNILVPIDFSDESRKAFYVALKYARQFDCDTTALHVHDVGKSIDDMEQAASDLARLEEGIKRRIDEMWEEGGLEQVDRRRVHLEIRGGKLWEQIVRYSTDHEVDLVVMGTSGRTGVKKILSPSQSEKVARHAPCNVLIVKTDKWQPTLDAPPDKFKV